MKLLIDGILLGLVLSVSIGPIFFALVQTSIRQGLMAGVFIGTGIWISDLMCITIAYLGLSHLDVLQNNPSFMFYTGLIGGLFLISLALKLMLKPPPTLAQLRTTAARDESIKKLWLQGFSINTFNPFTIIFWLTTMTDTVINRRFTGLEVSVFFGGILATIIITDFLKAYFSHKIRAFLQPYHLKILGIIAGFIVGGFGCAFIYRGVMAKFG